MSQQPLAGCALRVQAAWQEFTALSLKYRWARTIGHIIAGSPDAGGQSQQSRPVLRCKQWSVPRPGKSLITRFFAATLQNPCSVSALGTDTPRDTCLDMTAVSAMSLPPPQFGGSGSQPGQLAAPAYIDVTVDGNVVVSSARCGGHMQVSEAVDMPPVPPVPPEVECPCPKLAEGWP